MAVAPPQEETLGGSEYAHLEGELAVAVARAPTPMARGSSQRNLWGTYASTVLRKASSGELRDARCASPTRGAKALAAQLRQGRSSAPDAASPTSEDRDRAPALPIEDSQPSEALAEAPEIARARERAARARANAAKAVERAKAQQAARDAAAAAVAQAAAPLVRRRLAGKQRTPAAFPAPPLATETEAEDGMSLAASPAPGRSSLASSSPGSEPPAEEEVAGDTVSPTPVTKGAKRAVESQQKQQKRKADAPLTPTPQVKRRLPAKRRG